MFRCFPVFKRDNIFTCPKHSIMLCHSRLGSFTNTKINVYNRLSISSSASQSSNVIKHFLVQKSVQCWAISDKDFLLALKLMFLISQSMVF